MKEKIEIRGKFVKWIDGKAENYPVPGIKPNIDFYAVDTVIEIDKDKLLSQLPKDEKDKEIEELQNTIDAIEKEVSEVYCYITNGKLSKPTYLASVMKAEVDDMVTKAVEQEIEAKDKEIARLREFVDYILRDFSWQGCDVDGGDAQDKAVELGLVELRPISEEQSIDGEKEHYFTKWTPKDNALKGDI